MTPLEEKIRTKAKNCLNGWQSRRSSGSGIENGETYLTDITLAMLKIIKAEVNIRLQEERHRK